MTCACETSPVDCPAHTDHDPTDAELAIAWNGPDAHEAHRAAWALHQETHS